MNIQRPFNKPLADKPPPASSCARCLSNGELASNQPVKRPGGAGRPALSFTCPRCGNQWLTDKADAEAHGRFLRRIDPGQRNDQ